MTEASRQIYEFGAFRLDVVKRLLWREGEAVSLPSKAFETLLALVEGRGEILEKDELLNRIWPDTVVEEKNLTINISTLRKALGEGPHEHRYIVTVPGRGYRFVADVRQTPGAEPDLVIHQSKVSLLVEEETENGGKILGSNGVIDALDALPLTPIKGSLRAELPPSRVLGDQRWRIAATLAVFVVLGVALYWWRTQARSETSSRAMQSLAVLPFKSLNAQTDEDYLGVGMADVTITRLGSLNQLIVRPTRSVLAFAAQDPVEAGKTLKVDLVLDGSIQQAGDRLRVTLRLLRVADGSSLWTDQFDERGSDMFTLQDTISRKVTEALALKLTSEERARLAKRYTDNPEAYQLYLKGRYYWNKRTDESYQKGIEYFQQAIDKDPGYALAYTGLADSYSFMSSQSLEAPQKAMPLAKAAATRALQLDDTLAEAHTSLAYIELYYDWDWAAAEREYRRAIQLNPTYATPHHGYGYLLISSGRVQEGFAEIKKAEDLDPLSLLINTDHGEFFYFARQPEEAIAQFKKTLELDPTFVRAHFLLGRAYVQNGRCAEATKEFQTARTLAPGSSEMLAAMGQAYAWCSNPAGARQVLGQLQEMSTQRYISPHWFAATYAALGDKDQAFEWLDKAIERRFGPLVYLKVNPIWDPLRSDPRFAKRLQQVGLTE